MIIHLNGMPGVGKLTIAKALAEKLSARLLDNHLVVDLACALYRQGSKDYMRMWSSLTALLLNEIAQQPAESIFVLTNALANELPEDRERLHMIKDAAQNSGHLFIQILISCDLEENKARIINEGRAAKGKLRDIAALENIRNNYTIYHPETTHMLEVDVTQIMPEQAADKIKIYIEQIGA